MQYSPSTSAGSGAVQGAPAGTSFTRCSPEPSTAALALYLPRQGPPEHLEDATTVLDLASGC